MCCSCSICAPSPLALANRLSLTVNVLNVQRGWSRHRRVSSAVEESDLYLYLCLCSTPSTLQRHYSQYVFSTKHMTAIQVKCTQICKHLNVILKTEFSEIFALTGKFLTFKTEIPGGPATGGQWWERDSKNFLHIASHAP